MAKNRNMKAKNDKAKKCTQQSIRERNIMVMCHTPQTEAVMYKAYGNTEFDSDLAIQRRVSAIMCKYYNKTRFQKRYPNIYEYLLSHTVNEIKTKFATEIDLIHQGIL